MEDLNSYIEKAKHYASVPETPASVVSQLYFSLFPTPGVFIPPIPPSLFKTLTYWRRSRFRSPSTSRKSFDFFGDVVCVMIDSLSWEIHLWGIHEWEVAYLRLNFFRLLLELLVELFSGVTEINTVVARTRTAIEASRDPPQVFIPIPKLVESNGCARSDLDPFAYF